MIAAIYIIAFVIVFIYEVAIIYGGAALIIKNKKIFVQILLFYAMVLLIVLPIIIWELKL